MPRILGVTIMPLSNILFYLHVVVVVIFAWWEPLKAIYYHTRFEGDRSLPGLIQRYMSIPASAAYVLFLPRSLSPVLQIQPADLQPLPI